MVVVKVIGKFQPRIKFRIFLVGNFDWSFASVDITVRFALIIILIAVHYRSKISFKMRQTFRHSRSASVAQV